MPSGLPSAARSTRLHGLDPREVLRRALSPPRITGGAAAEWEPPPVAELARQFSHYELLDLLGRGGMGAVYRARQLSLARLVAIKILPLELSLRPEFAERFRREAQALARLTHPHIVRIYDSGQTPDGHVFFVMEFVDGSDLQALMLNGPVAVPQAIGIVREICAALEAAHAEGFVHRDVKPANVLIDKEGRVKVSDFGLTRLLGEGEPGILHALTGTVLGTPEYAAPEQARHDAPDQRSDLYSVGVMFYEMLTGSLPRGVFDPPSKSTPANGVVDKVVRRALQNDPDRRYQRAREMREDLRKAGVRMTRRTRALAWAGVLAVFTLAALLLFPQCEKRSAGMKSLAPVADEPFTNSLGQRFVPGGTPGVLFCTWETRVRDFEAFVKDSGHWVQPGFDINEAGVWIKLGGQDWRAPPGYAQTADHPVIGIGWNDAVDFCVWLTGREQRADRIGRGDAYRLPTDFEWSIAAGLPSDIAGVIPKSAEDFPGIYPWGIEYPPTLYCGNFAGEEMREAGWPETVAVIKGYRDKHTGPAPVGTYGAQRHGLFDLGGNVSEWVADSHPNRPGDRFLRGASWSVGNSAQLRSACR
jgi:hypothetical protein